jgi:hypothetical protein
MAVSINFLKPYIFTHSRAVRVYVYQQTATAANSINQLDYIRETEYVFCEVWSEILNTILMSSGVKRPTIFKSEGLKIYCSRNYVLSVRGSTVCKEVRTVDIYLLDNADDVCGSHCFRIILYTVEPGYNDIGLYDTSSIASDFLWYQLIPQY